MLRQIFQKPLPLFGDIPRDVDLVVFVPETYRAGKPGLVGAIGKGTVVGAVGEDDHIPTVGEERDQAGDVEAGVAGFLFTLGVKRATVSGQIKTFRALPVS